MEIRRLRRGDADRLRDVRLRALADAPYAFSSSCERESDLDPEFWTDRAAQSEVGDTGVVFVVVNDGHSLGMAGGFLLDQQPSTVKLWGMWVDPLARGGGLGQRLVEAVAAWAHGRGAAHLRLAVTDCDEAAPAAALYRKLGFTDTGAREPLEWNTSLTTRVLSRAL